MNSSHTLLKIVIVTRWVLSKRDIVPLGTLLHKVVPRWRLTVVCIVLKASLIASVSAGRIVVA